MDFHYCVLWRKFNNMISDNLEKTIKRAISYANDRQQEYVTLEHLLLALIEDKDALEVLNACNVDLNNLKISLIKYLDSELKNITSASSQEAEPSASFQRVLQRTATNVYSNTGKKIDGANVLVSIFSERESHADCKIWDKLQNKLVLYFLLKIRMKILVL